MPSNLYLITYIPKYRNKYEYDCVAIGIGYFSFSYSVCLMLVKVLEKWEKERVFSVLMLGWRGLVFVWVRVTVRSVWG